MSVSKCITIDNTGNNVQVLIELPKVVAVPQNIDNSHAAAVWLLSTYPDIKEMVLDKAPNKTGSPMLNDISIKMAMSVAIEMTTAQYDDGDVRKALDSMIKVWCNKQQEAIILEVVQQASVASGVISQEESFAMKITEGLENLDQMTDQEQKDFFNEFLYSDECGPNCGMCHSGCQMEEEPVMIPDPKTFSDIVSLLETEHTSSNIIEAIRRAEENLNSEDKEFGPAEIYKLC